MEHTRDRQRERAKATQLWALAWWLGCSVLATSAWADVGPIRYYERCTQQEQTKPWEECVWCSTFFRNVTKCRKKLQKQGYRFRCKRGGASVWREYWCREKRRRLTPTQTRVLNAAKRVLRAAKQNNPKLLRAVCSPRANPARPVQQLCQRTKKQPQWLAFSQRLKRGKLHGTISLKGTTATVPFHWDRRKQRTGSMRFILRKQRWYLTAITRW